MVSLLFRQRQYSVGHSRQDFVIGPQHLRRRKRPRKRRGHRHDDCLAGFFGEVIQDLRGDQKRLATLDDRLTCFFRERVQGVPRDQEPLTALNDRLTCFFRESIQGFPRDQDRLATLLLRFLVVRRRILAFVLVRHDAVLLATA